MVLTHTVTIELQQKLLDGSLDKASAMCVGVVDVRDVALAHVRAMSATDMVPNRHGQYRYITSTEKSYAQIELADFLSNKREKIYHVFWLAGKAFS